MTETFERTRWVATLPFDAQEDSVGIVADLEHTGTVRMKFPMDQARVFRDALTKALEESEGSRGPAHCAVRQEDGWSGEAHPAGPRYRPSRLPLQVFDGVALARGRGAIDHDRGAELEGNPYDSTLETANATAWAEGWLERDEGKRPGSPARPAPSNPRTSP